MSVSAELLSALAAYLPQPFARLLRDDPHREWVGYARQQPAAVLFADLAGFTPFAARNSPARVLRTLNVIFSAFDRLSERHRLEKIKTIGDEYMVAGGLPIPRTDHADGRPPGCAGTPELHPLLQ